MAVAGGTWLTLIAGTNASVLEKVGRSVGGGIAGLVITLIVIFIWYLFRASYKQRDEARKEVKKLTNKSNEFNIEIQSLIKNGAEVLEQIKNHAKFGDTWTYQEFNDWREKVRVTLVNYNRSNEESLWHRHVGIVDIEKAQHFSGRVSEACTEGLKLLENWLES